MTDAVLMTRQEKLTQAIRSGQQAGGDDQDWNAPEFQQARDLTEQYGCTWDFSSWDDTLHTITRDNSTLGGIDLTISE